MSEYMYVHDPAYRARADANPEKYGRPQQAIIEHLQ